MISLTWTKKLFQPQAIKARVEKAGAEGAREAAEFVLHRARSYCPVDTSELIQSIQIMSSQSGKLWHVIATAPHAKWVEYGSMHGGTYIPPNPFLRRAMADGRKEYPRILGKAMVRALEGQHLGASFGAL